MKDHRCPYCQQAFRPAPYHPQQRVCRQPACQRQRRRDYHRQKIASDPVYQQVCLDSPQKWRELPRVVSRSFRQFAACTDAKGGHFYAEQKVFKMTYWWGLSQADSA
jgi:hypothetical protein